MKNNLVATLADENYIDQAKQFFSSVYFNSGWQGDYMLLAYKIPENKLKWFRDRGILIKKCYISSDLMDQKWPETVLNKAYLFSPEFRKWKNIIYLDGDIIVNASIDRLAEVSGFAAAESYSLFKGSFYDLLFIRADKKNETKFHELKSKYDFNSKMFNTGVMAFNTDIIEEDSFQKLRDLEVLSLGGGEETIVNILFYNNWEKLPKAYNAYPDFFMPNTNLDIESFNGIISHFVIDKPWDLGPRPKQWKKYYHQKWQDNLGRADLINLDKRLPPQKVWSDEEIHNFSIFLDKINKKRSFKETLYGIYLYLDRSIGLVGLFLKHNFPKLYFFLKKLK